MAATLEIGAIDSDSKASSVDRVRYAAKQPADLGDGKSTVRIAQPPRPARPPAGGWVIIAGIGRANLFDHMLDNRRQLFTEIKFGGAERLSKRPDHGWIDRTGLACCDQPLANHLSDVQGGLIARLHVRRRASDAWPNRKIKESTRAWSG